MPAGFQTARFFFIAGGTLLLIGLILWCVLPIRLTLPPYLFTAALALGYGYFCWRSDRPRPSSGKEESRE